MAPSGSWRSEVSRHASLPSPPLTSVCSFRRLRGGIIEGTPASRLNAKILPVCFSQTADSSPLNFLYRRSGRVVYLRGRYLAQKTASFRHEWFGKRRAYFWPSMYISYYLQIIDAQILDSSSIPFCGISFHLCTSRCNVISNPLSFCLSFSAV